MLYATIVYRSRSGLTGEAVNILDGQHQRMVQDGHSDAVLCGGEQIWLAVTSCIILVHVSSTIGSVIRNEEFWGKIYFLQSNHFYHKGNVAKLSLSYRYSHDKSLNELNSLIPLIRRVTTKTHHATITSSNVCDFQLYSKSNLESSTWTAFPPPNNCYFVKKNPELILNWTL